MDEIRSIASTGLAYTHDAFDRERYERLMAIAVAEYAELSQATPAEVAARFARDVGYVTPKIGVDAAVFDPDGKLLLIRRQDSGRWALPGGWVDIGEGPEAAVVREALEEADVEVTVRGLVGATSQAASEQAPHASVHLLYSCDLLGRTPQVTLEAREAGFFDITSVRDWEPPHERFAEMAAAYWRTRSSIASIVVAEPRPLNARS